MITATDIKAEVQNLINTYKKGNIYYGDLVCSLISLFKETTDQEIQDYLIDEIVKLDFKVIEYFFNMRCSGLDFFPDGKQIDNSPELVRRLFIKFRQTKEIDIRMLDKFFKYTYEDIKKDIVKVALDKELYTENYYFLLFFLRDGLEKESTWLDEETNKTLTLLVVDNKRIKLKDIIFIFEKGHEAGKQKALTRLLESDDPNHLVKVLEQGSIQLKRKAATALLRTQYSSPETSILKALHDDEDSKEMTHKIALGLIKEDFNLMYWTPELLACLTPDELKETIKRIYDFIESGGDITLLELTYLLNAGVEDPKIKESFCMRIVLGKYGSYPDPDERSIPLIAAVAKYATTKYYVEDAVGRIKHKDVSSAFFEALLPNAEKIIPDSEDLKDLKKKIEKIKAKEAFEASMKKILKSV